MNTSINFRSAVLGQEARGCTVAAVALLLAASLVSRSNLLDVPHSRDEYEYAAMAAYLQATEQSPFSLPSSSTWVHFVYLQFADWFGAYRLVPVRGFVLVLCWLTAVMIYAEVSRMADRGSALLASLFFIFYSLEFEGASANREWFAGPLALLGMVIAARGFLLRADERRPVAHARRGRLLASGGLLAAACVFKDQALPLALVVPAVVLLRSLTEREWREKSWDLGAYASGFLAVYFASLTFYAFEGRLAEHFQSTFVWISRYAVGNTASRISATDELATLLGKRFFAQLPYRSLLILSHGMTILVLLRSVWRTAFPRRCHEQETLWDSPLAQIGAVYFLASAAAISAGFHFFHHYYLFILPAWCLMLGFALNGMARRSSSRLADLARLLLAFAVWLDVWQTVPIGIRAPRVVAGVGAFVLVFCLGSAIVRIGARIPQPFQARRAISLASTIACFAAVIVSIGLMAARKPVPIDDGASVMAGDVIRRLTDRDDRIFVWGWLPEVYAFANRIPATQYVVCNSLVNDIQPHVRDCRWDAKHGGKLLAELERTRPRLVVDVSCVSVSISNKEAYRIARYPALEEYLRQHYRVAAVRHTVQGDSFAGPIVFYERLPDL